MSKEAIQEKEAELEALAFAWAKERGLVVSAEQVRVKLSINSDQLTEEDWAHIFAETWEPTERRALMSLKNGGNKPIRLEWSLIKPLQKRFNSRRQHLPFRLAQRFQNCRVVKRLS